MLLRTMLLFKLTILAVFVSEGGCSFELVDKFGRKMLSEEQEGLLLYNGGTVCGFGSFDDNAASAICKMMGFDAARSWRTGFDIDYKFVQINYSISLADVRCSEPNWSSCFYDTTPDWHCDHHLKDVFLICARSCSPGMYRSSASCVQCPSNTYKAVRGIQKSCAPCPESSISNTGSTFCSCVAGKFWSANTICQSCPQGSVSQKGSLICTQCPSGSIVLNLGTSCSCPAGKIWIWGGQTSASCKPCPQGTYKSERMSTCTDCPSSSSSDAGSKHCACKSGMFWSGTVCQSCPDELVSQEGALECSKCPSGSIAWSEGSSCSCLAGTQWSWDGQTSGSCIPCPQGTYKTEEMLTCLSCPEGTTSSAGANHCFCNAGMFWNKTSCHKCTQVSVSQEGALQCTECPSGSIALHDGRSCSCPVGTVWSWSANQTSGSCALCPADKYRNSQMSACSPCPSLSTSTAGSESCSCLPATYKNQREGSCNSCPTGTSSDTGSEHCICSAGKFWNVTKCQDCAEGSASQEGALQCVSCRAGYPSLSGGGECACPEGSMWSWIEPGVGTCTSLPQSESGSISAVLVLACISGLLVIVSLIMGLLLVFKKRRGKKKNPERAVSVYDITGDGCQIVDQQMEQRMKVENNLVICQPGQMTENIYDTVDITAR